MLGSILRNLIRTQGFLIRFLHYPPSQQLGDMDPKLKLCCFYLKGLGLRVEGVGFVQGWVGWLDMLSAPQTLDTTPYPKL